MTAQQSKNTPIPEGVISRAAKGMLGLINPTTWFSPGNPLKAEEPAAQRTFAYAPGVNVNSIPRSEQSGISFHELRALAESCDLVRLAIETRKDQLGALDFIIQPKEGARVAKKNVKQIQDFLAYPDKEHVWGTWLRMIIEDLLVIDAPTIYPRKTKGGDLYSLEVIDGSTIKRILDAQGRTPMMPQPAYQQNLYGIPSVDFTREELIYHPRNPRAHKIYGFSPVEQIILTVNIAIRKQISQLQFYTEGTIPDSFATVPQGWGPQNIEDFQRHFDELMSGDTAKRRKVTFLPPGSEVNPTKPIVLKDMYDEWLARIICFAFSLPPTPFINQVNRSMAEAAQETALEEGLAPLKQYIKDLMNYIITFHFKSPDIEFIWRPGETEQDPLTLAQIQDIKIKNNTLSINEARDDDGRDALSDEELEALKPAPETEAANDDSDVNDKERPQEKK